MPRPRLDTSRHGIRVKETGARHYGRRHKYGAVRTTVDGISFDSKREAAFYQELTLRKKAGEIHGEIDIHPVYPIIVEGNRICTVELDFAFHDTAGKRHYIDVKGRDLPMSRLKRKLLFACHGIRVEVIR